VIPNLGRWYALVWQWDFDIDEALAEALVVACRSDLRVAPIEDRGDVKRLGVGGNRPRDVSTFLSPVCVR